MFGAISGGSAGNDFPALGDEASKGAHVFVIDSKGFVRTKSANFAPSAWATTSGWPAIAFATTTLRSRLIRDIRRRSNCFVSVLIRHRLFSARAVLLALTAHHVSHGFCAHH
jgi:hypothetical protein